MAFTVLWVLARMKVFGQRNGVFFALSIVVMLGAAVGLVQQAWRSLGPQGGDGSRMPGVALHDADSDLPPVTSPPEPPLLVEAFKLDAPEATLPRVRAVRDLVTTIGGKSYRIRKGDTFLMADEKPGKFLIAANELIAPVPIEAMEQLSPQAVRSMAGSGSGPEGRGLDKTMAQQVEQRSRTEAIRRYPALARAGSDENRIFVETYNDLKQRKSELLDDPEWPLHLAEMLAQRLGWEEAATGEDPAADLPPSVVEPSIAPGTRMLVEPDAPAAPPVPPAESLPEAPEEPAIPLPPPTPR